MSTIKVTNLQAPSAASAAFVLAADGSATAQLSSLNGGALSGARNRIINGNFDFWQRGTSSTFSASGPYLADRWAVGGGTSTTVSRQSFTPGQTDVPGEPTYFLRWDITNNSQNYEANQKIEDVRTFAGQQATLSFYARRTSGTVSFGARIVQDFGTGGSPSSLVVTSLGTPSLTTSWQKFTYTVSVPSISGKTLGTDGNSSLWTSLQIGNTGTGVIELAQVQFEPGSVATPFERRSYGQELALCQRYYYRVKHDGITNNRLTTAGLAYSSTGIIPITPFLVEMRTAPTSVEQSGTAGHYAVFNASGSQITCSAVPAFNVAGKWYAETAFTVSSGLIAGNVTYGYALNSAAYLGWSAEL